MKSFVYIIYSEKIQKFYIGSTRLEPSDRPEMHLQKYYGSLKFTARSDDWKLYFEPECVDFTQALKIESHIKRMKSKKCINESMF